MKATPRVRKIALLGKFAYMELGFISKADIKKTSEIE
jgi:hypothetical protein